MMILKLIPARISATMARDKLKELRRRVYLVLEQGPVGDG